MRFAPNTGYAFAVADDTWHSVDEVGADIRTRNSILLTYFVDQGALRRVRNRSRRIGNFILHEARHLSGR
jgi:carbohydrate-selective porin OprB